MGIFEGIIGVNVIIGVSDALGVAVRNGTTVGVGEVVAARCLIVWGVCKKTIVKNNKQINTKKLRPCSVLILG